MKYCCANIGSEQNPQRCNKEVFTDKDHCSIHITEASKLCHNYKKIGEKIDITRSVESNLDIRSLLKIHGNLSKVYEARVIHRNYAYVPESVDYGHKKKFSLLLDRLAECESLLSVKFLVSESEEITKETPDSETENIKTVIKNISKSKKIRAAKEKKWFKPKSEIRDVRIERNHLFEYLLKFKTSKIKITPFKNNLLRIHIGSFTLSIRICDDCIYHSSELIIFKKVLTDLGYYDDEQDSNFFNSEELLKQSVITAMQSIH